MTGKRFTTIYNGGISPYYVFDNLFGKKYQTDGVEETDKLTDLLNKLNEENEQLKQQIQSINKDLTQIMLIPLDDDILQKLTETELKAFERLSKFKGDDRND